MPRKPREDIADRFYHVINRANARMRIFFSHAEYVMLQKVLLEGKIRFGMRIHAYCIMPNHFHLVLQPRNDGDMQKFMRWITLKHTQLWHAVHETAGTGHVYQGRYKSFPISNELHLLTEFIYIERNPVRACLVDAAAQWKYSSLRERLGMSQLCLTDPSPINLPENYLDFVNDFLDSTRNELLNNIP